MAGKGDKNRVRKFRQYQDNFSEIDFSIKVSKEKLIIIGSCQCGGPLIDQKNRVICNYCGDIFKK
jgi:hypothetical protein